MSVTLIELYQQISHDLTDESAAKLTTYLEQNAPQEQKAAIDELRHVIKSEVAGLRAEIKDSKASTIWAFVVLMVPTWVSLFILLYNYLKP